MVSPEANVTPVARPFATSIRATSASYRIVPPRPWISPTSPCTSAPMPPMA